MSLFSGTATSNKYITVYLSVTEKQYSATNNSQVVAYEMYLYKSTSSTSNTWGTCSYSVNIGGKTDSGSGTTYAYVGKNNTLLSGEFTIVHDSDGSKTIDCSCEISGYIVGAASGSVTLTDIPRASTLSFSTFTMGTAGTITITRASTSFTHTVSWTFGSASGTIATKTTSTQLSWTPATATLAPQVPSATSGTGKLTCYTYSGSTLVGSNSYSFTAKVPTSVVPTVSSFTVQPVNSNQTIAQWGSVYVKGYTKVKYTLSGAGTYGSTIQSYAYGLTGLSTASSTTSTYTTATMQSSGTLTAQGVVKDSRGRSSTTSTASVYVYNYSAPTISSFRVQRGATDDTAVSVTVNYSYQSVGGNNACTATVKYRRSGTSAWTTAQTVSQGTTALSTAFDNTKSFEFMVSVSDSIGNTAEATDSIQTASVLMDFKAGGTGLAVGKMAEYDNLFEVGLPAQFNDNVDSVGFSCDGVAGLSTAVPSGAELTVNGGIITGYSSFPGKLLWSGVLYMSAGQTATLSECVSAQSNGIVLVFSSYDVASSVANDYGFSCHFIPKYQVSLMPGKGYSFILTDTGTLGYISVKYLYINDSTINGDASNTAIGTSNGVTYTNNRQVLRYVIGV